MEPVILMMSSQEKPFLRRYMTIVVLDINEKYYNNQKLTGMRLKSSSDSLTLSFRVWITNNLLPHLMLWLDCFRQPVAVHSCGSISGMVFLPTDETE